MLRQAALPRRPLTLPGPTPVCQTDKTQKLVHFFNLRVSVLRLRGHANLLCIIPTLSDDPRRESGVRLTQSISAFAAGHISPNAPDLFRPPKLSGGEPV